MPPPAASANNTTGPFRSQGQSDAEGSLLLLQPKHRPTSPSSSVASLAYRRSNPALSTLFASTSAAPVSARSSGSGTPTGAASLGGSVLFAPSDGRSVSPVTSTQGAPSEPRNLLLRAFAPHVGILASADTDELLRQRGFAGGFLELVRPFGELVSGRVTVRDSIGASRTWDDFGIRFTGIRDSLGVPRLPGSNRPSFESSKYSEANGSLSSGRRSRSSADIRRMGGDVGAVENVVERHLSYAEVRTSNSMSDFTNSTIKEETASTAKPTMSSQTLVQQQQLLPSIPLSSPFYSLYFRRLLSALPITPHETFSHPVACVIAISSRNPSPIEEFKRLYNSSNSGDDRLPMWVNNEFLRYYVLVHDEDNDDITKSTALYEQMKKHFGLHCHLLRLRSAQCIASDDDCVRLPVSEWMSAGDEMAVIQKRELLDDLDDPTPCLFESDATAIRMFVRELVTQSIIPSMERLSATWNEQVPTRRRGLSGRLMSLSKRWTPFGTSRNSSPVPSLPGGSSNNYDSLQGFYRPDAPEAVMRKLADFAFMLRDFKLAQSTYDMLRSDFENDKAWKYYAGANEMCVVSTLLNTPTFGSKSKSESLERMIENASHSYVHRCGAPFYALRTLVLGIECLRLRGGSTVDDTARWGARILEMGLVGPVGHALLMERVAGCYALRTGVGPFSLGARKRKLGFWNVLAADAWVRLGKAVQAERCLEQAKQAYCLDSVDGQAPVLFQAMTEFIQELQQGIVAARLAAMGIDPTSEELLMEEEDTQHVEEVSEALDARTNRRSVLAEGTAAFGSSMQLASNTDPLSPVRSREALDPLSSTAATTADQEGFE